MPTEAKNCPSLMQRGQALTQQVHATVGVVAVDHPATVAKLREGFAWVIGAAEDQAAMIAGAGVGEFVAWAADTRTWPRNAVISG